MAKVLQQRTHKLWWQCHGSAQEANQNLGKSKRRWELLERYVCVCVGGFVCRQAKRPEGGDGRATDEENL